MKNIILIGPMGSGKTTLGKAFANNMELPFIDTDVIIKLEVGKNISSIFAEEGESFFRDYETKVLKRALLNSNKIIATGGGVVITDNNLQLLKSSDCIVVYLQPTLECLYSRLENANNRPLLNGDNKNLIIKDIYEKRHPLYLESADITLAIENNDTQAQVNKLKKELLLCPNILI